MHTWEILGVLGLRGLDFRPVGREGLTLELGPGCLGGAGEGHLLQLGRGRRLVAVGGPDREQECGGWLKISGGR